MRVLLAEDHPAMQQMITALLATEFQIVAVVAHGDEVLQATSLHLPDIVVLDVSLPGRSGLQILPELRKQYPSITVAVLTTHAEPVYRHEAMRRGADAYVLKGHAARELLPAIRTAVPARRSAAQVRQWA